MVSNRMDVTQAISVLGTTIAKPIPIATKIVKAINRFNDVLDSVSLLTLSPLKLIPVAELRFVR